MIPGELYKDNVNFQTAASSSFSSSITELSDYITGLSKQFCDQKSFQTIKECVRIKALNLSSSVTTSVSGMGATFTRLQVGDSDTPLFGSAWLAATVNFGVQVDWLSVALGLMQQRFIQAVADQQKYWTTQADAAASAFIVAVTLGAIFYTWLLVSQIEQIIWYSKGLLFLIPTAIIHNNEQLKKAMISQKGVEIFQ